MLWIDLLAIPADAPHVDAAYKFSNFILQPEAIAQVTNATRFANASRASLPWIKDELKKNPLIYPDPKTMSRRKPGCSREYRTGGQPHADLCTMARS